MIARAFGRLNAGRQAVTGVWWELRLLGYNNAGVGAKADVGI
jgi:hypothetical protein